MTKHFAKKMRYKAIFIDIDDTLLDYVPCCREAFDCAMEALDAAYGIQRTERMTQDQLFDLFFDISGRVFSEAQRGSCIRRSSSSGPVILLRLLNRSSTLFVRLGARRMPWWTGRKTCCAICATRDTVFLLPAIVLVICSGAVWNARACYRISKICSSRWI